MLTPEEAEQWLKGLSEFDRDNEILFLCMVIAFGKPDSYLDVGSGTGAMVETAQRMGIYAVGLDQLPRPHNPHLFQVDLRNTIQLSQTFDLVSSIETAEHIEPEYADHFVKTLTSNAKRRIVFTAAQPGQIGHRHYNCQPMTYWREKFHRHGWIWNPTDTYRLALIMSVAHHASHHVEANLSVFTKS